MAFAVGSKGTPLASLLNLKKLLLAAPPDFGLRPASVAVSRRLFNTGGAPVGRDDKDRNYARRRARDSIPVFYFSDEVDPRLGQLLALMEDNAAATRRRCEWWVSKEDDDAVQLKVAMPGLGKEHVKLSVEKDSLVVNGDKDPEDGDDQGPARYSRRIGVPSDDFKMDQIKGEMDNGVLKITLPKVKNNECKDRLEIKIE